MNIFKKLLKIDLNVKKTGLVGLTNELSAIAINNFDNQNVLVVCSSLFEASNLYQAMANHNQSVLFFPMDDFLSSEIIELNPELKITRIETINKIIQGNKKNIVVTNLMGYLRFLPTKENWKKIIVSLKKDTEISYEELIRKLYNMGYEKRNVVSSTGEMGIRGYIIDIFPIGFENPIRIEFFDNLIESIRIFEAETQKSISEINEIKIFPFSEFIAEEEIEDPREQKYLPKYAPVTNVKGYLNDSIVVYKDYNLLTATNNKIVNDVFNYNLEKKQNKINYMHKFEEIINDQEVYLMTYDNLLTNIKLDKLLEYKTFESDKYYNDFSKLDVDLRKYLKNDKTIVICLKNSKEIKYLTNFLQQQDIVVTTVDTIIENKINLIEQEITQGFIFGNYVFIGNYDIFDAKEKKTNYRNDYRYGTKIGSLEKLEIGDYIVHAIHGIGIYNGVKVLAKNGLKKDYIEVLYRSADKLYIPVEKINLLNKYASKDEASPKINKLGTTEWIKTKISVRKRIGNIADKLLKLYANRAAEKGFSFGADTEEQIMFESEFVYEPTKDQLIATAQIKQDMEKPRAMDRLLCGDVGFGKTEVAFRAAFKAVSYSKQVMYLCPTTILANQQYEKAKERFKNYPVNIGLLSRFTVASKVKETVDDFGIGKIDILFGTHRILSQDIRPYDLGLLIIDEEQRFGVIHKEKIKEYKKNVDVLTLSATPIPRTLQMSLVGIRNLSLIETPPVNRYPISTYVTPFNKQVIKEAIYSELSRNGQVFILYNKISNITQKVEEIQNLVKEAKITYAHGGMSKTELENKMLQFVDHKYDVLVCTTIIEAGIDIPNVNTLIVIDANNFGLSQLYQIRGRVGRTNKIAYAYLMYDGRKTLTETAIKRLQTIKDFTQLGSGFKIASRDLAIRGAGDILGSEQAGFIDVIGIGLYIKMLNEEIDKIKGLEIEEEGVIDEKPLIDVETHIEANYVDDNDLKIEIHRIINEINSYDKLIEKKQLIEDRFGKITEEMDIYMHECWFENLAKDLDINRVIQSQNRIEIILPQKLSAKIDGQKLFLAISDISLDVRFAYKKGQIRIMLETYKLDRHFIYYLVKMLETIKKSI